MSRRLALAWRRAARWAGVAVTTLWGISTWAADASGPPALRDAWSAAEVATLTSMQWQSPDRRPVDPSNAYEQRDDAARLGRALFHDTRLSRNGAVACATCHATDKQFEDGRPVGQGLGAGKRRTMPVMGAAHAAFLFWDGRKDSLWSQALGPLEDPAEHGGNRLRYARQVQAHYQEAYQKVFGALPDLGRLPPDASPNGTQTEQAAWAAMAQTEREAVNRVFANMGKAIAAYERGVAYGASRFDRYARATLAGDAGGQAALTPQEVRGLRLFLNQGQCVTCHNGPQLSDHAFHNTGVPPRSAGRPDRGRVDGLARLRADEFNCLGPYSDARAEQCGELEFLSTSDPAQVGAFRTPSLRNVAARAPYMHAGQFATLEQVLQHYARAPQAAVGRSELAAPDERRAGRLRIRLSATEIQDLAAFLATLTGPVIQPK